MLEKAAEDVGRLSVVGSEESQRSDRVAVEDRLYGFVVGLLVYRSIGFSDLPPIFIDSARATASVLFILSGALFVGMPATLSGLPAQLVALVDGLGLSPIGFLVAFSLMLLVLGCFLDGFTLLTVVTPLLLPTVHALGIDPIHFAIVLVLNIEIAAITPPIGLNLFVITGISGTTMREVSEGAIPFIFVLLAVLVLIMLVPWLSLGLL